MSPIRIFPRTERRAVTAFVSSGGLATVQMPVPTPEGLRLREERGACGLSLREAARACGMTAVEFSGLETGAYGTDQWEELVERLRVHARRA